MKSVGLWMTVAAAGTVLAQPQVPPEFVAVRVAPIGGHLVAVNNDQFGNGVISATQSGSVVTFRLIEASGSITPLGTASVTGGYVIRSLSLDRTGVFGGELHFTTTVAGQDPDVTRYYTFDHDGAAVLRFTTPSWQDIGGIISISSGNGSNSAGGILFDSNAPTSLAFVNPDYSYTVVSSNSVPSGRSDLDFARSPFEDVGGLFGGGHIIADQDCNTDNWSAVYSISNAQNGGAYTQIGTRERCSTRRYNQAITAGEGPFGGFLYVTDSLDDVIYRLTPSGDISIFASNLLNPGSMVISDDEQSIFVGTSDGIYLIREAGNEPGPTIAAQVPSVPDGSFIGGDALETVTLVFTEPVAFEASAISVTDSSGTPIGFDATGSGSQFMIIGFATPLKADTYTITVADTLTAVATGQPLDGDNDGVAGGAAEVVLTHRCDTDLAAPAGLLDLSDINRFVEAFTGGCE